MTAIITQDGTVIVTDPELGAVSGRNKHEAETEIARRKGLRGRPDGTSIITTRHSEIQAGDRA